MPHGTFSEPSRDSNFRHVTAKVHVALEIAIVIANIFPVATVFAWRSPRVVLDELIVALSVSYLLSALVPSPLGLVAYFTQTWYGGIWTCALYQLTVTWLQLTAMCLVTCLCVERWLALRRVKESVISDVSRDVTSLQQRKKRARYVMMAVYVGCLFVAALPFAGLAPPVLSTSGKLCQTWFMTSAKLLPEHVFYVVFLVVGFSNVVVAMGANLAALLTLWRSGALPRKRSSIGRFTYRFIAPVDRRTMFEFTAMTSLLSTVFYIAWIPALVMISLEKAGIPIPETAMQSSQMFTILTGLLNPLIYAALSRPYRVGYVRCLRAASRLVFGCPVTYAEVLSDISGRTVSGASTGSSATSRANLLSTTTASDIETYDHLDDDDGQLLSKSASYGSREMHISTVSDAYGDATQTGKDVFADALARDLNCQSNVGSDNMVALYADDNYLEYDTLQQDENSTEQSLNVNLTFAPTFVEEESEI